MATWAQIVGNIARDLVGGDGSGPHVAPGYDPNGVSWTKVPDGTLSGATSNGDGTYTNPVVVETKPSVISPVDFVKRFTLAERAAILGSTDATVKAFSFELQLTGGVVNLQDPDTIAGTNYLEQTGVIGAGRAAQILTP